MNKEELEIFKDNCHQVVKCKIELDETCEKLKTCLKTLFELARFSDEQKQALEYINKIEESLLRPLLDIQASQLPDGNILIRRTK